MSNEMNALTNQMHNFVSPTKSKSKAYEEFLLLLTESASHNRGGVVGGGGGDDCRRQQSVQAYGRYLRETVGGDLWGLGKVAWLDYGKAETRGTRP
jgi:hypothetical protein